MSEQNNSVVFISSARLSFPKLIEAESFMEGGAKKFSADFILRPDSPDIKAFMAAVGAVAQEKWKEHAAAVLQMVQNDRKLRCYGAGSEKVDKKTFKPYNGYDGMLYIGASSNEDRPPKIINAKGVESNGLERGELVRKLYGGCYVNAVVRPWSQDNQYGRAIRCELIAVQFAKDGEAFGEAPPDLSGMFKPILETELPSAPFPSFMQ